MLMDRIRMEFDFLFSDYKFVPSGHEDENNAWVLVLILGLLRLRFTEDRADLFLDVGFMSEPDVWHELGPVLSLVRERKNIKDEIHVRNSVKSIRALLKVFLDPLVALVKEDEFRDAVTSLKSI